MRRVRLPLAPDLRVDFVDRELALRRIEDWVNKGMRLVEVVYGPEGCGKTAWLLQSAELLKDFGFDVIYVNPLNRQVYADVGITSIRESIYKLVDEAISQNALAKIAWIAYNTAYELIKARRGRVAVLIDDAFQVIGVRESAMYVKALLNLIEYPPAEYERIITVVATSEGISRREIGRHLWAHLDAMWNLPRVGYEELYGQIPNAKLSIEETWRLTGGNPRILGELITRGWDVNGLIDWFVSTRNLEREFISKWRDWLEAAINDPDTLWVESAPEELINTLIEQNIIIYSLPSRDSTAWIDTPPPERDPELGVGRYVAWQSPLHREVVRRILMENG